jgi:hypothetical protein
LKTALSVTGSSPSQELEISVAPILAAVSSAVYREEEVSSLASTSKM